MARLMAAFNRWFASSLGYAFGDPLAERQHQPPLLGVQPYRDHPHKA